jgi:hypothetical protein
MDHCYSAVESRARRSRVNHNSPSLCFPTRRILNLVCPPFTTSPSRAEAIRLSHSPKSGAKCPPATCHFAIAAYVPLAPGTSCAIRQYTTPTIVWTQVITSPRQHFRTTRHDIQISSDIDDTNDTSQHGNTNKLDPGETSQASPRW